MIRPFAFLSEVYLESGDVANALKYAQASYDMELLKTDRQPDEIGFIQATKILGKAHELNGNYQKAHYFLKLYNEESGNGSLCN